jgi:hypothetical protein
MDEQTKQESAGKRMAVFLVTDREEQKASWLRLGSAFFNRDGSINLFLEAMPVAGVGKLQLRPEKPATSAHAVEGVRS